MAEKEISEIKIIALASKGNQSACNTIVNKYRDPVLNFLNGIIPNKHDAEDICQETFQKCFRYLHSYNQKYAFSTWLFTIAQNTALDFLRKNRIPLETVHSEGQKSSSERVSSSVPSPEENMIDSQAIENLIKAIQNLPPIYRKVSELRFIHDYPIEEISKELKIPVNTVKTRISRSKKILNTIWKK